jgi:hypothetical protein
MKLIYRELLERVSSFLQEKEFTSDSYITTYMLNLHRQTIFTFIRRMNLKLMLRTLILIVLILTGGCISKFIPEITEDQNILVVDGLITDQCNLNTIKLSTSSPLGKRSEARPLSGCEVTLTDDIGSNVVLSEAIAGSYVTPSAFQGEVGRLYTLHVKTNSSFRNLSFKSLPMEMKATPPIDSVYYVKQVQATWEDGSPASEGCQIFMDTHDPENSTKFWRWDFTETWDIRIPYYVPNNHCWVTANSDKILIKNTSALGKDIIIRQPINLISYTSDRLRERYSILVNQYSLSDEEFSYWDKLQNITQNVGSLYDMTPSSIPSNVFCVENPGEKVLGYFSVSSVSSKRIFIREYFRGLVDPYRDCANSSTDGFSVIPGLGFTVWIIVWHLSPPPPYRILTFYKSCADCTTRGTTQRPDFWVDN